MATSRTKQEEETVANEPKTIKVKTSKKVNDNTNGRGAFTDPDSKATIGSESVEVENTAYVQAWLSSGDLVRG